MVLDDVAEILAVSRAAARVGIEDDVTFGRHPLKFMVEDVAVGGVRAAVNVQDERIFLAWIEVRRLLHPGLNLLAVEARVPDLFRLGEIELREELVVDVRELPGLSAGQIQSTRRDRRCWWAWR